MEAPQRSQLSLRDGPRRRPGRPSFDSAQTRTALLDAAEELFANFGVEGTSIRSINAAAGFAPTAVHRHFGSKDRLLEAVVRRRGNAMAARQRELLDALAAESRRPTALCLVEAWATPYRELIEHDPVGGFRWLQLLARLVLAQDPCMTKLSSEFGLVQRLTRVAPLVFPGVPEPHLQRGLLIALGTLIQMMANRDIWTAHDAKEEVNRKPKTDADMLVRFVASGLGELMASTPESFRAHSSRPPRVRRSKRKDPRGGLA